MPFLLQHRLAPGCLDKMTFETPEDQSKVFSHPCTLQTTLTVLQKDTDDPDFTGRHENNMETWPLCLPYKYVTD